MNSPECGKPTILIAEDDDDDRLFLETAFGRLKALYQLSFVADGEELMDYLHRRGKYGRSKPPRPGLVLLDLNMPKKDGRKALLEIKRDDRLKTIPVIVWTTSSLEEDMRLCKEAGAEGYVTKPSNLADFNAAIAEIVKAWVEPSRAHDEGPLNRMVNRVHGPRELAGGRLERRRDL
ncbi:MAG: response regulator [Desulfobacteraceae bacterium]|nr:MAG: response regulator [Desulfobacteraceae bacterium]